MEVGNGTSPVHGVMRAVIAAVVDRRSLGGLSGAGSPARSMPTATCATTPMRGPLVPAADQKYLKIDGLKMKET